MIENCECNNFRQIHLYEINLLSHDLLLLNHNLIKHLTLCKDFIYNQLDFQVSARRVARSRVLVMKNFINFVCQKEKKRGIDED